MQAEGEDLAEYAIPGTSNSQSSSPSTSSSASTHVTTSRRSHKRKTLQEVDVHFIEAANSFKEMCSSMSQHKKTPNEDELFAERVVAFVGALHEEEDKNNAKAAVLKHLADCVAAQYE